MMDSLRTRSKFSESVKSHVLRISAVHGFVLFRPGIAVFYSYSTVAGGFEVMS